MGKGAILIGIIFIIFGIILITATKFHLSSLFYGIPAIAIGIALIVLNKEEEKIEQRKDLTKNLKPKKTR